MTRTKIPFHFSMFATAVLVAACGGGDATAPGGSATSSSGFAVDGYLNGATVVCDANGNGLADSGERTVISDSSGFFRFTPSCESALIATGGTSVDTGLAFTGTLRAPSGATVITPLTTLIASGMSESKLKEVLGITATGSLLTTDPARTAAGSLVDADLMKKTLVLQQLAQKIMEVVAGLATSGGDAARAAIYSEVMAALAQALAANPALVTGSTMSESVTQALVKAAAQRVAASTTLPAGVKAGVAALNADSLAQVIAGALKAQGETILGASGDTLTAKTKTAQESTTITSFVQTNKASNGLTQAPSATTGSLSTNLKDSVSGTTPPPANGNTELLNFDTLLPVTALGGEGGEGSGLVAAPAGGGSGQVYRVLRSGGQTYALAVLEKTIPFTADRKTISAQVFSPAAGIPMVMKMEGPAGASTGDVQANEAVVAGWQTLTWTFTSADPTKTYNKIVLLPRLGTVDAPPGQSYYFDNIQLNAAVVAPPAPTGDTDLLNFDTLLPVTALGGEGGEGSGLVAAPAGGGSGQVYRVLRSGGQTYALAVLEKTIPFTADRKTISAQVFSPAAGIPMVMKMEGPAGANTGDVQANEAVVAGWQTLTWTFTSADPTKTYNKIVLLPRLGTVDAPPGQSYYFDNIKLKAAAGGSSGGSSEGTVMFNFDTLLPVTAVGGEGGEGSGLVAAPAGGGSGQAYRVLRSGGQVYALAILEKTIPFTADRKTISAKVYSPLAGIPMVMKMEGPAGANTGDKQANEAVVQGWQTLTWTFSNVDTAKTYNKMVLLPRLGTVDPAPGQSYYFDDITLNGGGTTGGGGSGSGSGSGSTPGGNPDAAMGSGGPQTMAIATANDPHGLYVTGNGVFAGDYIGTLDANNNHAGWLNAATRGTAGNGNAANGNIGYYQDNALSNSSQKVEENGWVTGNIDNAGGVPGFFRYFILRGPASSFNNSFMGLYVNARNNGTVDVSSYGNIKFKLWGPAEMYQNQNLNPQLEVILAGPKVPGCVATGSGGTEIKKTFTANQKVGAGSSYTISLAGWTVNGVCGTDTNATAANTVLTKLSRVVFNLPGTSFNFTNATGDPTLYATGINLGPIVFTP